LPLFLGNIRKSLGYGRYWIHQQNMRLYIRIRLLRPFRNCIAWSSLFLCAILARTSQEHLVLHTQTRLGRKLSNSSHMVRSLVKYSIIGRSPCSRAATLVFNSEMRRSVEFIQRQNVKLKKKKLPFCCIFFKPNAFDPPIQAYFWYLLKFKNKNQDTTHLSMLCDNI